MKLFTPISVKNLHLKNRLVMAPMGTNYAERSFLTDEQEHYYLERAKGGVGLIIVEYTFVNPQMTMGRHILGIFDDIFIPRLKEFVSRVHETDTKIAMQIFDSLQEGYGRLSVEGLERTEIKGRIDHFVAGAVRVRSAGFDAVEFHMAHCHAIADFLSPNTNTRSDEYGGSVEKRCQIAVDIVQRTRKELGNDYPLLCRINGDDFTVGGNTTKQGRVIAKMLVDAGADIIHVSVGSRLLGGVSGYDGVRCFPTSEFPDGVNVNIAAEIKREVKVPVIAVGKITLPGVAEEAVAEGKADLIALGRSLLADPYLPNKVKEGRWDDIVQCKYCNWCFGRIFGGRSIQCVRPSPNRP